MEGSMQQASVASATRATVIMIGDRFFFGFSRSGATLTAWSLAGARMFGDWTSEYAEVCKKLNRKGTKFSARAVELVYG